ncbi:MAG: DNA-directed RNA polymerase subunit A'' [archaeon]|nr:DNA-directed RNA polymerase subunit A'' [archaeon]
MANSSTVSMLVRKGVDRDVATHISNEFGNKEGIQAAGFDGLMAVVSDEAIVKQILEAVGSPKKSTSAKKEKASVAKAESEETAEPAAPVEEYFGKGHNYTETELYLKDLAEKNEVVLPLKVISGIAATIDKDRQRFTDDICVKLLVRACEMYNAHKMCQNESAGVMAAHSIGEPGTQMNLRTFHFAGVASISVTQGLPRLVEIVDARREPSTPSMRIPLVGLAAEDESLAKHVAYNIETTKLINVATIQTDITNLRILIVPDARSLDTHDLTLDDLVEALNKIKVVRGLVEKISVEGGDVPNGLVIYSDPEGEAPYAKLQEMYEAIRNARIKGIDKIKRALIDKDKAGKYFIVTEGSNLKDILNVEYIDRDNVMTNSILEIADVFGIEAARNSIIHEAKETLGNAGLDVDIRHIMLVADLMTNDGTVRAIGRNGVSGKKSSVLARAAFEITAAHLLHAAMVGEVDRLEGVTENIIVGQPVTLGTGAVKLVYDPKKN